MYIILIMENEDVTYVSYRNDEGTKELWRVSPVTKIAEFIVQPDNMVPSLRNTLTTQEAKTNEKRDDDKKIKTPFGIYTEYYKSCFSKIDKESEIDYITEYLIKLDYCEFEKEGNQLHFKKYDEDPEGTIMKSKDCNTCEKEFVINTDKDTCLTCISGGAVEKEVLSPEQIQERSDRKIRWSNIANNKV